jgi:Exoribonuclease R
MQDHIGEKYEGIITGVQGYGFYVELPNTVEGLVRISSLTDDYYSFNPDRMELVGQRKKRMYRLGMKVNVVVLGASKEDSTIDFGLTGKNGKVLVVHKDPKMRRDARKVHRHNVKEGRKGNGRRKKH